MSEMASVGAAGLRRRAHEEASRAGAPAEIAISYPVPSRDAGGLVGVLFATVAVATSDRMNFELYPPAMRIRLRWATGEALAVETPHGIEPIERQQPLGLLRAAEFVGPRYEEQEDRLAELETALLDLLDRLALVYGATEDDPGLRAEGLAVFRRLVPEPIRAAYTDLNPDFLGWLEGVAGAGAGEQTGAAWSPTHLVPPGGMQAWAVPDPGTPVIATLDPGLPLQVVEIAGDWGRVVASNGWTGWVDARRLIPGG